MGNRFPLYYLRWKHAMYFDPIGERIDLRVECLENNPDVLHNGLFKVLRKSETFGRQYA